jgi:hypothetical protein
MLEILHIFMHFVYCLGCVHTLTRKRGIKLDGHMNTWSNFGIEMGGKSIMLKLAVLIVILQCEALSGHLEASQGYLEIQKVL